MSKNLVLLGAGPAHLRLLAQLARRPLPAVRVTLISKQERVIDSQRLMAWVAGRATLEQCSVEIEPLVHKARAQWLDQAAVQIDARASAALFADGREMQYDWLSINLEAEQNRQMIDSALPGARANALFAHPREAFCKLWPGVPELAASRALRVAVVCDDEDQPSTQPVGLGDSNHSGFADAEKTGQPGKSERATRAKHAANNTDPAAVERVAMELAFSIHQRLPGSAVTLITGGQPLARNAPGAFRHRLDNALKQCNITVLQDAASAILPGEIVLRSGARLACDVPLLATQPNPPSLAASSGLALDGQGFIKLDASLRSSSHPNVWVALDDWASANHHARNLRRVANHHQPAPHPRGQSGIHMLACGQAGAIATWGGLSLRAGWLAAFKDRTDRQRLAGMRSDLR
jgi:NADH dehydrogenase FAD-containing subunit